MSPYHPWKPATTTETLSSSSSSSSSSSTTTAAASFSSSSTSTSASASSFPLSEISSSNRSRGFVVSGTTRAPPPPPSAAMRIIVPLQGVVQGRGGVFWGSVIPCALFYFLQLYIRQRRPSPPADDGDDDSEASPPPPHPPPRAYSSSNLSRVSSSNDVTGDTTSHHNSQQSYSHRLVRSPRRPPFVSARAVAVSGTGDSPYYIGWREFGRNPFHAIENPDGIVQLGLAENLLSYDLLEDWLKKHPEASSWDDDQQLSFREIAPYQYSHGILPFKSVLASFMEDLTGRNMIFHADNIVVTAGATAAIEILGFCLAEAGDAFLVPSPYYPGFDRDITWRNGVELIPVHCSSNDSFTVSRSALEKVFSQTQRRGIVVRGLLVTTPGNPSGHVFDADTFRSLFDFARDKRIHLISDEVYAASVYKGKFLSAAEILASGDYDHNFVHIIYGLSKDFGIPGFRVGVLYTANEKILSAARNLTRFCGVSSQTQRLITYLLQDNNFVTHFLEENQQRLRDRHNLTVERLQQAGISTADSKGGLYCWVDMHHLLTLSTPDGEKELWKKLLYEVKVSLTPGSACHCNEPGWFRLCFSGVDEETLDVALSRLQMFTEGIKK